MYILTYLNVHSYIVAQLFLENVSCAMFIYLFHSLYILPLSSPNTVLTLRGTLTKNTLSIKPEADRKQTLAHGSLFN